VIYTPWDNLKKTPGMETGQVTFFNHKKVKRVHVEKRINEIVNRLNKTKVEREVDYQHEKIQREKIDRKASRESEFQMVSCIVDNEKMAGEIHRSLFTESRNPKVGG
jgi:hypothetical protein